MNEQKKTLEFLPSYLLDILCFLELLCSDSLIPTTSDDERIIYYFEECLTQDARNEIKRIQKLIPKEETLTSLVFPLVLADQDFENFQVTELLGSPKFLISMYKKSDDYQRATKGYKKFVKRDAQLLLSSLVKIVAELEKVKFKVFWIEERLPRIKHRIKQYEKEIGTNVLIEMINERLAETYLTDQKVYLLSFNLNHSLSRVNEHLIGSLQLDSKMFIHSLVEQLFKTLSIEHALKPLYRSLKKNKELMMTYKEVKSTYNSLLAYIDFNVKLAFITSICSHLKVLSQPYEYLGRYEFGSCKPAVLFYDYMNSFPKNQGQQIEDYLLSVVQVVELDSFEQRSISILKQQG